MSTTTTAPMTEGAIQPGPIAPLSLIDGLEGVPYLLSADDYYAMVDSEIIPRDRRVFLWEGRLYEKMGKNQPHAIGQSKLLRSLYRNLPGGWYLAPENPVEIAGDKVPLPDMAIVRGDPDDYPRRPPTAKDVSLIVEMADTSVRKDTGRGLAGYARALIPIYWVVNLVARRVEVYTRPAVVDGRDVYESAEFLGPGDVVPLVLDGVEVARIPVRDILPAEPVE